MLYKLWGDFGVWFWEGEERGRRGGGGCLSFCVTFGSWENKGKLAQNQGFLFKFFAFKVNGLWDLILMLLSKFVC